MYVLDFAKQVSFPEFLTPPFRLMVGAGDLNHGGIPNTQKFSHNVFFCNGWDWNGSFQDNIDYVTKNKKKVICRVDYTILEERKAFIDLFKGRFSLIDGHGGHTPHFSVDELRQLLCEGGEAVNIHETSESLLPYEDALYYLDKGYFRRVGHTYPNRVYLTSRIIPLTPTTESELHARFLEKVRIAMIDSEYISLEGNPANLSLRQLQEVLTCFSYDSEIPLNMRGSIRMNQRCWRDDPILELVLNKIPIDYMTELENNGNIEKRAMIIERIKEDIDAGFILGQRAKYRTLRRLS